MSHMMPCEMPRRLAYLAGPYRAEYEGERTRNVLNMTEVQVALMAALREGKSDIFPLNPLRMTTGLGMGWTEVALIVGV